MDDMYQYTASAVNSNKDKTQDNTSTNQQEEENDVVLKAFNNINWGRKWTNLLDTVKKQSEAFVEGTKKDLQEFAQVLTEDASDDEEQHTTAKRDDTAGSSGSQNSRNITSGEEEGNTESALLNNLKDSLGKINTVNFTNLRDGLVGALKNPSSQLLKQVHLPENMDLIQLKEGLNNRTRSAEQYLQRFGTEVLSSLKNTVTVLVPEEEQELQQEGGRNRDGKVNGPRVYATRKEALIAKMQTNENTYLKEPEITREDEKKVYETFNSSFNINEYTEEIAQLLEDCPKLRDMMDSLVPVQVSYPLFWQRYFYHAWKIDQDEQKRLLIVQQHQGENEDDEDFKWDSDDEEEGDEDKAEEPKTDSDKDVSSSKEQEDASAPLESSNEKKDEPQEKEQATRMSTSSNSEDTDDFSHISAEKTEDEWVETEKKKSVKEQDNQEDSDSDWE